MHEAGSVMPIDWSSVFAFSVHPLEVVVRGSVMYWFLYLLFRFVIRRDTGAIGIADILLLVIIADASQNAMAGDSNGIADGMLLVGTIAGWNVLIDWLAYRFPLLRRALEPKSIVLIRHGRAIERNMRSEMLSMSELMARLRTHGIERLDQVKIARMEADGDISVIRAKTSADSSQAKAARGDGQPPGKSAEAKRSAGTGAEVGVRAGQGGDAGATSDVIPDDDSDEDERGDSPKQRVIGG